MKRTSLSKEKLSSSNDISELWRGQSLDLLKQLHIITRDGRINADTRRKLKQVYHLVQFIEPLVAEIAARNAAFKLVDVGAGKSYLGFILYDLLMGDFPNGRILSIESRPELVEKSSGLARSFGFERMDFVASAVADASVGGHVDMVCALHACDTATDDAIIFGLKHDADAFVLVPCCQAEVAKQLEGRSVDTGVEGLWRFPIHRREFGSHLTNVMRVLFLESLGYKVTVTELVGWEHSLKNELIIAVKPQGGLRANERSRKQLEELVAKTGAKPKLLAEAPMTS